MGQEHRFTCGLRNGLHARPASMLSQACRRFVSSVRMSKDGAASVDARSVLSVVGLDVRFGDACVIEAEGDDAEGAIAALRELIDTTWMEGEEEAVAGGDRAVEALLPRGLRNAGVSCVFGRAVCPGVGEGVSVMVDGLTLPREAIGVRRGSQADEREAARRAVEWVRQDLEARAAGADGMEGELLRAHAEMASDPALWECIERAVNGGATAARAVEATAEEFSARLRRATSAYIRDRVLDVQDVCTQVLLRLVPGLVIPAPELVRESVVFAEALTANQLLRMDRTFLKGIVLGRVGATSHTVILARTHGIPTVIDVERPGKIAREGELAVVDGDGGFVVTSVGPEVSRYYARHRRTCARVADRLRAAASRAAVSGDGVRLEVGANASTASEVAEAAAMGADGVGLLRTEMLFLERAAAPTEHEQFEAYSSVLAGAAGRAVIIRTFDIGADKPAAYLKMPREENPFLGVRGLRLYERHEGLLEEQLRAIVRAAARGPVKVMAPMVTTPDEARWFRQRVRRVQSELRREGIAIDERMPVGVMVEVPALALVIDQLCDEVDFISIGTNDLSQYSMAFDRANGTLERRYSVREPSFLRLVRMIVRGAKEKGTWVGVCGEMAGDPFNLPLMIGLGLDEISVASRSVAGVKSAVSSADAGRCRDLVEAAVKCRTAEEVEGLLRGGSWRDARTLPILDLELIEDASDALTKDEAIKEAVDLLLVGGRTDRPRSVEDAVWAREATYSTGLGHGFAVPHCKSEGVGAPSLAILKLRNPVDWDAMDGQPVRVVMLLAMPASEGAGGGASGHMKVFAKLARRLMHEEFRERVLAAKTRDEIRDVVRAELEIE